MLHVYVVAFLKLLMLEWYRRHSNGKSEAAVGCVVKCESQCCSSRDDYRNINSGSNDVIFI